MAGVALLAAGLALAGCGFRPLYGERSAASVSAPELAAIQIDLIPNREGQLVRNALLDKMQPRGPAARPLYRLTVGISIGRESFGLRTDDTATRSSMTMSASYILTDLASGKPLLNANSRAVSSYNILDSDFATVISENDAIRRTANEVSEEIKTRVAIFLSSRKS
ncbi:MAG: LPS assembly lipoprotein LptE [Alphaproteobacteria bacterium]